MTSNFHFIPSTFPNLAASLKEAEQQVYAAPPYAAVLCRKALEEWVRWLYENDADLHLPYDTSLNTLMHDQDFKDLLAPSLFKQVNLVRKLGNVLFIRISRSNPPKPCTPFRSCMVLLPGW